LQILSVVPFAALRKPNSPSKEGYLVQSHTLSVTPSLRMLQHCNERWKELKQDILDSKPGTIVAVGDPACADRLEATGEEVDFIEGRFGKEHVKKLVGAEATPSEVLKWAKYPSENRVKRVKQVIFHIAAHGSGADADRNIKQGAIFLARPASSCQVNYGKFGIYGLLIMAKADMLTHSHMHLWFIGEEKLFDMCRKKIVMSRRCVMLVSMSTACGYSM